MITALRRWWQSQMQPANCKECSQQLPTNSEQWFCSSLCQDEYLIRTDF